MIRAAAAASDTPLLAVTADPASAISARQLARELNLPFLDPDTATGAALLLRQSSERLELYDVTLDQRLAVEFTPSDIARGRLLGREPLGRALGRGTRRVIDATAGLGGDSILLAARCAVIAIERHPAVAALLRDGVRRAERDGVLARERVTVVVGDARTLLPQLAPGADAIFLDPMFPPKRKRSAAVRKEQRLLRALVGDDADAGELLDVARACSQRVIVKRPAYAQPLALRPTASYTGKLVRYDVYRGHG